MVETPQTATTEQPDALDKQQSIGSVPACTGRLSELYDVQKAVGKGGYAVVYKGIRRNDGRVVAVKRVEIFEMTQKKRDRCLQEVTLLRQLSHPYIIQMLDAFIDENMLIIIFEWAPAGDLKRLIKKTADAGRTLDEPSIWNYFFQIVDGLRYMHSHRIMHRDIKPANVLVGANGALKLGDLGLGRQLSEQTMEAFSKVGTPYYVSPEVVRGAGYDWKSDVWSLGCLLYELACLKSPFEMEGANLYDVFQRISKGDYQPLPDTTFSSTLRGLVARMLNIDPAGRPDLEEVWSVCVKCCESQSKARGDLHLAAETLHAQLILLETVVNNTNAIAAGSRPSSAATAAAAAPSAGDKDRPGSSGSSKALKKQDSTGGGVNAGATGLERRLSRNSSSSKRRDQDACRPATTPDSKTKAALPALPEPPSATLRTMHPTYFAEPLCATGSNAVFKELGSEELQKQQIGAFLQCYAWLLSVAGHKNQSETLQKWLEVKVVNAKQAGPRSTGLRHQSAAVGESPSAAAAVGAHGGSAIQPSPPGKLKTSSTTNVVCCTNILKGAEAAKHAAQSIGLHTEFATISAIGKGHGRAVCALLQDLLDVVLKKVPLVLGRPDPNRSNSQQHRKRGEGAVQGGVGGDDDECEDVDVGDDGAMLTNASPLPAAYRQAEAEEGDESEDHAFLSQLRPNSTPTLPTQENQGQGKSGIFMPGHDRIRTITPPGTASDIRSGSHSKAAHSSRQQQTQNSQHHSDPPLAKAHHTVVDPVEWQREVERVAPQLSRIKISASALGGTPVSASDWMLRWERLKSSLHGIRDSATPVSATLQRYQREVTDQLDRIQASERRIQSTPEVAKMLELYALKRKLLESLQRDVSDNEELHRLGQAAMSELNSRLEAIQQQLQDKAAGLDGSLQLKQMRDALVTVKTEMGAMDKRLGVLRASLLARQRQHMATKGAAAATDEEADDDT